MLTFRSAFFQIRTLHTGGYPPRPSYGILFAMSHIKPFSLLLSTALLTGLAAPTWAQAPEFALSAADRTQVAQYENKHRTGETAQALKKNSANAMLLSTLYPGLGQFYVGNDNARSTWITVGGTVILVGSLIGWSLLSERPPEARTLGDLGILAVLLGYHGWNMRDAFVQADEYNTALEKQFMMSLLENTQFDVKQDTVYLSWKTPVQF